MEKEIFENLKENIDEDICAILYNKNIFKIVSIEDFEKEYITITYLKKDTIFKINCYDDDNLCCSRLDQSIYFYCKKIIKT